ncbi:hypothetical protein EV644_109171 [Kribbella orskensis]|uniref:DUF5605 domain-containing protein n=1 Tax=Kribbella orskensis TaxID=2512216 RepID=A0ABY2BHB8_9ACTN|nr:MULTISPECIES: DUF5605 domain-containing protein [Kribbella]TCN38320.1 hypothetical protein EV642_109105 [Kribbella sp. VKM Ac-2500]TCO20150.1 hypothetical protein EV644_109171 [Kribbella orskensis]
MTVSEVERWGVFETSVDGGPVAVEFRTADGDAAYVESFDGEDGRQLVRFMPDVEGEWTYELAGVPERFVCTPASERNHGPVRRVGADLRWADGTPYRPLTTTWFDQPGAPDRWTEACRAIAASPFDRVRLRVRRNDLARLDARTRELLAAGIGAELVISETDELFLRELVNRLAAYRNVTWCFDDGGERRDWRREAELVAEYDSGRHLISVHGAPVAVDPGPPWLSHLSVPLENLRGVSALRRDYGKPVHVDSCGYEGNGAEPATSLTGPELLTRIWEGTVRGAQVAHGEWYVDAEGGPWSGGGSRPAGVVAQRLRLLRQVLAEMPDGVEPIEDYRDAPTLAVPGSYYLQYLGEHRFPERTFSLPEGTYRVEVLDVWNHAVRRFHETVTDTLTVRLPGTQYQAVQIRRAS